MDILNGGDLRYHISRYRKFSEEQTRFFISNIIYGLEYIHDNNVIHRDIKPENLVLDDKGYVRITDFGIAKENMPDNSSETSGTPGYMAPEVMKGKNHSFPVDFFAIGVIGYEFMLGRRPYCGKNRKEIKDQMMSKAAVIDEKIIAQGWSQESADFINKLLERKEQKRLGYKEGARELMKHQWLKYYPWEELKNKKLLAPFVPDPKDNFDKHYCESIDQISEETKIRYEEIFFGQTIKSAFVEFFFNKDDINVIRERERREREQKEKEERIKKEKEEKEEREKKEREERQIKEMEKIKKFKKIHSDLGLINNNSIKNQKMNNFNSDNNNNNPNMNSNHAGHSRKIPFISEQKNSNNTNSSNNYQKNIIVNSASMKNLNINEGKYKSSTNNPQILSADISKKPQMNNNANFPKSGNTIYQKKPLSHSNSSQNIYSSNNNIERYLKIGQNHNVNNNANSININGLGNKNQVRPLRKTNNKLNKIIPHAYGNKGNTKININNYYTNNIFSAIYNNFIPRHYEKKVDDNAGKKMHHRAASVFAQKRSYSKSNFDKVKK